MQASVSKTCLTATGVALHALPELDRQRAVIGEQRGQLGVAAVVVVDQFILIAVGPVVFDGHEDCVRFAAVRRAAVGL